MQKLKDEWNKELELPILLRVDNERLNLMARVSIALKL